MKEKKQSSTQVKPRPVLAITLGMLFVGIVWLLIWLLLFRNYAQEAMQSIESKLVGSGATRICGTGDTGRGPDNRSPHYRVLFESSKSIEDVKALLVEVSKEEGFTVKDAQVNGEGDVQMAGEKQNSKKYPDLAEGNFMLNATIYGDVAPAELCGTIDRNETNDGKTTFIIGLNLTAYR